jgi:hypothetical protein
MKSAGLPAGSFVLWCIPHMKSNLLIVTLCLITGIMAACNQNNTILESEKKLMQVTVVSLEKCSATQATIELVKETAKELNINIAFKHVVVKTPEDANEHRHIGSPTVQINGIDIDPQARNITQFGIT